MLPHINCKNIDGVLQDYVYEDKDKIDCGNKSDYDAKDTDAYNETKWELASKPEHGVDCLVIDTLNLSFIGNGKARDKYGNNINMKKTFPTIGLILLQEVKPWRVEIVFFLSSVQKIKNEMKYTGILCQQSVFLIQMMNQIKRKIDDWEFIWIIWSRKDT